LKRFGASVYAIGVFVLGYITILCVAVTFNDGGLLSRAGRFVSKGSEGVRLSRHSLEATEQNHEEFEAGQKEKERDRIKRITKCRRNNGIKETKR
jgi:hypothetical protein